jgi:hypothetical protein
MDNKCNIFQYSPKELTTDAFFAWLFYFLDSDNAYNNAKQQFFRTLLLKEKDKIKNVENIKVFLQEGKRNGRTDLQVSFNFGKETERQTILFENKTWSGTKDEQLNGYKSDFPNLYKYVFLKLGYIDIDDKNHADACGYEIIDCFKVREALKPIQNLHPILEQYFEYLEETFCKHIESFQEELFNINKKNYDILGENHGEAQHYLMGIVFDELNKHRNLYNTLFYKQGTSSGRPWTEIVFEDNAFFYDSKKKVSEALFWRVDCRQGERYYLRINQYAGVMEENNLKKFKEERLKRLREIAANTLKNYPKLIAGTPSNRWGANESEVVIFFLDDNDLSEIINQIANFTADFMRQYNSEMR